VSGGTHIEALDLAAIRADVERAGLQQDPLVGVHKDRAHLGLNITVAWPLPAHLEPAYIAFAERLQALDSGLYVYPFSTTHVTLVTAVNFRQHADPAVEATRSIGEASARLGDFVMETTRAMSAFAVDFWPPVLARAAAFVPMQNRTGEIALLRERALAFCRAAGGILSNATAPKSIHSTIARFRELPPDALAFARAFDEIAHTLHLGSATIDRVLVTLEAKPYMRAGRVVASAPLGG
jgi:hypothetical protein